jgi:hypothetical protein
MEPEITGCVEEPTGIVRQGFLTQMFLVQMHSSFSF